MREAARELRGKYEEMRALRLLAASGLPHDPRPQMVKLAARWPGALRELDALPGHEIDARVALLCRVEEGAVEPAPSWVGAMHRFHALARGVLYVKRSLRDGTDGGWPGEAAEWRGDVARIAKPPRGRLMVLVFERLGRELGVTAAEAKRLVFG